MGIFTRFRDIISANINSLLDKAEDPEKMLRLMIHEMEDTLIELKASCASTMANEKKAKRTLDNYKEKASRWENRAKLAVEKQRDDLAREALFEKKAAYDAAEALEKEIKQYETLIKDCKANIIKLEEKLEIVYQKRRSLVERKKHVEKKIKAEKSIRNASGINAMMRFEELENRIERAEAEADLINIGKKTPLENEFSKLEKNEEIEKELEDLKKAASQSTKKEVKKP